MANDASEMDDDSFELDDDDPALEKFGDDINLANYPNIGQNEDNEEIEKEFKRTMQVLSEWNMERDILTPIKSTEDELMTEENATTKSFEKDIKNEAIIIIKNEENETKSTYVQQDLLRNDVSKAIKLDENFKNQTLGLISTNEIKKKRKRQFSHKIKIKKEDVIQNANGDKTTNKSTFDQQDLFLNEIKPEELLALNLMSAMK